MTAAASSVAWSTDVPQAEARPRPSALAALATALTVMAMAAVFSLSPMLLARLGVPYEQGGGSAITKIHPATWLAACGVLVAALARGNPISWAIEAAGRFPYAAYFVVAWLFLLAQVSLVQRSPLAAVIDTFLLPLLLFLLLARLGSREMGRMAVALHLLFAANAALGLAEYATGWRLTPYVVGASTITGDWRSTALFGHPLVNATLTACYALALVLGGGGRMPLMVRIALCGLQLAAMAAFGGRAATVLLGLALALRAAAAMMPVLAGRRFGLRLAISAAAAAPLILAALAYAVQSGILERFIERFVDDNGSAQTRLVLLDIMNAFSWPDLLLGPDPATVLALQWMEGSEYGIESLWIGFALNYGLLMSVVFFIGLFAFCAELVRATRPATAAILLFSFVLASTSASLSTKTVSFALLTAMLTVMMRRDGRAVARGAIA